MHRCTFVSRESIRYIGFRKKVFELSNAKVWTFTTAYVNYHSRFSSSSSHLVFVTWTFLWLRKWDFMVVLNWYMLPEIYILFTYLCFRIANPCICELLHGRVTKSMKSCVMICFIIYTIFTIYARIYLMYSDVNRYDIM